MWSPSVLATETVGTIVLPHAEPQMVEWKRTPSADTGAQRRRGDGDGGPGGPPPPRGPGRGQNHGRRRQNHRHRYSPYSVDKTVSHEARLP